MRRKIKKVNNEYNDEDLKRHMALPAEEKLEFLEQMNQFFSKVTPAENKKIWNRLQKEGWQECSMDLSGLNLTPANVERLFSMDDGKKWEEELTQTGEFFRKFGARLPDNLQ